MRLLPAFLIGIVFGLGILISGMANPAKVVNFFDVAGTWDPSLAFVMGGALVTTFIGYKLVLRRRAPLLDAIFHMPHRSEIDLPLVAGSAIFGIGWGIAGFCPGAALPALGTLRPEVVIFVATMIAGILAARLVAAWLMPTRAPIRTEPPATNTG